MRFEATVSLALPGNDEKDAIERLRRVLPPGWDFMVNEIKPSAEQPPPVTGELNIKMPAVGVLSAPATVDPVVALRASLDELPAVLSAMGVNNGG